MKPKPMVEIGGMPILWHIMIIYAAYGFKEFVIALGYKGEMIKDYFINYHYRSRNITVELSSGDLTIHNGESEDWIVHLLDTGLDTQTGGRIMRVANFIGNEPFMLTYGDGVANINIPGLLEFHKAHGKLVTLTALRPRVIECAPFHAGVCGGLSICGSDRPCAIRLLEIGSIGVYPY